MTEIAAVDAGDARDLVAMMDATDGWPGVRAVVGDASALPLVDGAVRLVRAERMLQWSSEPAGVLAELGHRGDRMDRGHRHRLGHVDRRAC
jgi:hypothetical protein